MVKLAGYILEKRIAFAIIAYILFSVAIYEAFSIEVRIPCIFNLLGGFKCYGCGLSSALGMLLKLDFAGAYSANALIFPIVILAPTYIIYDYYAYLIQRGA